MPAFFDASWFDGSWFDTGSGGVVAPEPTLVGTGVASCSGVISVVSPLVFSTARQHLSWYATVIVGSTDISARLTGVVSITAAEDSARLATLSVIPASSAELASYDSAPVTIDVTLFRPGQSATYRRFTGRVERVDFEVGSRVATLSCRDGWQERPAACTSAAQVEALFGGLAAPSGKLVQWDATQPDPAAYFSALLATMRGATAIDSSGVWRAIPWAIGTPAATFGAGDIYDDTLSVRRPARADVPSAVVATLTHRFPRLHAAEKHIWWEAPERVRYVVDGLPLAPKSMIADALRGIAGWLIKGEPIMTSPLPGSWPVIVGGDTVFLLIGADVAPTVCETLEADIYRRWYQQVDVRYSVTIDMGGASERDESIAMTLESAFDNGAWETAPSAESNTGLYLANAPTSPATPTGYEGLPEPWPPGNGAIDHHADITPTDLQQAAAHVVALAVRRAAAGRRQQQVRFERPIDPRWEIGDVLSVNAIGVVATGQVVEMDDRLDHDSGEAVTALALACPGGAGPAVGYTASVTPPEPDVTHALPMALLDNHIGAAFDTPAAPVEDNLVGFLCNVLPTSDNYDASKPVYQPQFRIIAPEIPAAVRDPLVIDAEISATVVIGGGQLEVTI